jgi:TolA-binding protein
VKPLRPTTAIAACAAVALLPSASAMAQRQAPTPEQRLERLERQVQQVQRQVFPRGRPADTAGFLDEPAATQSSVARLDQRLDALERQLADILRLSEENGHRLRTLETDLARARDEQQQRLLSLEQRVAEAAAAAAAVPAVGEPVPSPPRPTTERQPRPRPDVTLTPSPSTTGTAPATDAGEEAYTVGFKLWEAGQYDQAIAALRAFTSDYPRHRRVSFANNLIGRALLDKGDPRAAAQVLLSNYRSNPRGERAGDSLYYLGQALMRLGQPAQACNFYAEFDAIYGTTARADLRAQVDAAKSQAKC